MINLIAAVGLYGEIGYKGRIPWRDDDTIANITDADLGWFAKQTQSDALIVGSRTYEEMLTMGFRPGDREVVRWNGREPVRPFLEAAEKRNPGRDIWICGGAWTYQSFMPFVQRFYISRIPWTGPADRYMPPIQANWAYMGGPVHGSRDGEPHAPVYGRGRIAEGVVPVVVLVRNENVIDGYGAALRDGAVVWAGPINLCPLDHFFENTKIHVHPALFERIESAVKQIEPGVPYDQSS